MKNFFILSAVLLTIFFTHSSCKKCFNCTITATCGKCTTGGTTYCNTDLSVYDAARTSCAASGETWIVTSMPSVTEYCDKPSNTANIDNKENACHASGGVWTNK
jgi:hypothetical protein